MRLRTVLGAKPAPGLLTSHSSFERAHTSQQERARHVTYAKAREYVGSDGRRKSTIEEAFKVGDDGSIETSSTDGRPPPWSIGWQTAEDSLAWNDDVKARLISVSTTLVVKQTKLPSTQLVQCMTDLLLQLVAAEKLNMTEEEFSGNLLKLQQLLPNLSSKIRVMKPDIIVQLAANPDELAMKLVRLKQIFPKADTTQMVCSQLSLVLSANLDLIAAAAEELRDTLPNVNVDR